MSSEQNPFVNDVTRAVRAAGFRVTRIKQDGKETKVTFGSDEASRTVSLAPGQRPASINRELSIAITALKREP